MCGLMKEFDWIDREAQRIARQVFERAQELVLEQSGGRPIAGYEERSTTELFRLALVHQVAVELGEGFAQAEAKAVRKARAQGASWTDVGQFLRVRRQSAQERFGSR